MRHFTVVLLVLCATLWAGSAAAQMQTPKVDKREHRQQERIRQGVKGGELTPAETKRLEMQQARINRDEQKAKSDGTVTPHERAKLQHEQNKASKTIYRRKHNARTTK